MVGEAKPMQERAGDVMIKEHSEILEIWHNLRGNNEMPRWSAEDLVRYGTMAGDMFAVNFDGQETTKVLFHGATSVGRIGFDFTGTDYLKVAGYLDATTALTRAENVLSYPCGSIIESQLVHRGHKEFLYTVVTFGLPFFDKNGDPKIIQDYYQGSEKPLELIQYVKDKSLEDNVISITYLDIGYGVPSGVETI
jgi:hypothetical protein